MTTTILLIIIGILLIINIALTLRNNKPTQSMEQKNSLIKMEMGISKVDQLMREEFGRIRNEQQQAFMGNREELSRSFTRMRDSLTISVTGLSSNQKSQFSLFSQHLTELTKTLNEKTTALQEQIGKDAKDGREEQTNSLRNFENRFTLNVREFNELQKQKFDALVLGQEKIKKETEDKLKEIRETVESKLKYLQEDNNKKLEEMRRTVDEKLQETVEKRFTESFKLISERLDQVHKGLGEMQTLASGVGDLKKVLTNVKTRGNLGEIQLGAILEQTLSPEQYETNATIKENSQERVEYAIKLPNKNHDSKPLLLPIDSKFPVEDYQRLLEAYDNIGQMGAKDIETISKQFENAVKKNAKDIRDKYIDPPTSTDFGIMFVPTEGLYAEILKRIGLFETLQRDYKITVVGPTNLVAFLSSLQMGFRTLAIEKRSSEVWEILGAVKTEFGHFGTILEKTKKKLQEATNVIDKAGIRTRAIERKLRTVQELPQEQSSLLIGDIPDVELEDKSIDEEEG